MSDRLLVATRKGVFTLQRERGGWKVTNVSFLGDNCSMVLADHRGGTKAWYAALGHGHFGVKVHRSADEGKTWEEVATPKYPEKPVDWQPRPDENMGKPIEWSLQLVWALEAGGEDQPDLLWCGTLPGGLFKSIDGGRSWAINEPLWFMPPRQEWFGGGAEYPGIHSVCVHPKNSNDVTIGVSCGGVWRTFDGGQTWESRAKGMRAEYMPPERAFDENIQDPHRVAQCRTAPESMWVQHHNGIFRTTDGGRQWTEIKDVRPSVFGFGVVAHPEDANKAWFVPAVKDEKRIPTGGALVVTRTKDGGQSFETLSDGLPQEHAYHLVFRHALDIDESGDRLAFGSTTGGLWVSENQGDSWSCAAMHLPPIYAVRFVAS
jgi:hypothetical protein